MTCRHRALFARDDEIHCLNCGTVFTPDPDLTPMSLTEANALCAECDE